MSLEVRTLNKYINQLVTGIDNVKLPLKPTIFSQTVIFVAITLLLFLFFRIYDIARVIHMNMEIALICAHLCLIAPDMTAEVEICRIISILTHFFFLACFMFMFLEAIHVYAMVASVVHKDGMFTKWQNVSIGTIIHNYICTLLSWLKTSSFPRMGYTYWNCAYMCCFRIWKLWWKVPLLAANGY